MVVLMLQKLKELQQAAVELRQVILVLLILEVVVEEEIIVPQLLEEQGVQE